MSTITTTPDGRVEVEGHTFPPFDLARLLRTVFELSAEESYGVFVDLPDPRRVAGLAYLRDEGVTEAQRHAYETLFRGLEAQRDELHARDAAFYAYAETGASNLDLPPSVHTPAGGEIALEEALARHTIVLFMGRYSATAPVTALARKMGFRGATMHGTNAVVLAPGLAVDYEEVSARAERLREAMTRADTFVLEWDVGGERISLDVQTGRQEAQKSHGLVRETGDIANLPAGEVYYVPTGADGLMPMQFEDAAGTIAVFTVRDRGITGLHTLVRGDAKVVREFLDVIASDPNAGQITELGMGTQTLPWAHTDIQDEKILGTAHLATGRSDHLGGRISSASFKDKRNAAHNDVLFSPVKTPDIRLACVTLRRNGETRVVLEDYRPTPWLASFVNP